MHVQKAEVVTDDPKGCVPWLSINILMLRFRFLPVHEVPWPLVSFDYLGMRALTYTQI